MEKLLTQGNGRPEKRKQPGFRAGWDSARWLVPFTVYLFPLCLFVAFLWQGVRVFWQHRHGVLLGGIILIAGLLLLGLDWAWLWIWKRLRPEALVKEPASVALYRMGAVFSLVLILAGLALLLTNPLPWRPPPTPLTPG